MAGERGAQAQTESGIQPRATCKENSRFLYLVALVYQNHNYPELNARNQARKRKFYGATSKANQNQGSYEFLPYRERREISRCLATFGVTS